MPLKQILRRANAFDERAAHDARRYLESLQAELTRRLMANVGDKWGLQHFESARREVYSLLAEIERKLSDDLKGVIEGAGEIGKELADDLLKDLRVDVFGLPKLTLGFVREAANASATLVKGITDGIRQKIDLEIDRGIQGLQTGIQTIKNIASIRGFTAGAFKTAVDRAEFIFRTEASRIINMATIERYKEFSERSEEEMLKYWLATNDSRTRETHEQIWRETDPRVGGTPIAFQKDFKLNDGEKGFGPSAPTFSAENVINCRCRLIVLTKKKYLEMIGK